MKLKLLLLNIKWAIFSFFLGPLFIFSWGLWHLFSQYPSSLTDQDFSSYTPEVILVFTGDQGRIPKALEIAQRFPKVSVFVTGVKSTLPNRVINQSEVYLDIQAENTLQNIAESLKFLKNVRPDANRILLVGHDYHLPRINLLLKKLWPKPLYTSVSFYKISSPKFHIRRWPIYIKEYFKYIMAFFFHWAITHS